MNGAPVTRSEFYSRAVRNAMFLRGEWIAPAGFIDEMPIKIRVLPDCIIITAHNTRELWGCAEDFNVAYVNKNKMEQWIEMFPGTLNDTSSGTGILGKS